jgi:hypothetical protein
MNNMSSLTVILFLFACFDASLDVALSLPSLFRSTSLFRSLACIRQVVLKPLAVPDMQFSRVDGTSDALYAFELALMLEKFVYRCVCVCVSVCPCARASAYVGVSGCLRTAGGWSACLRLHCAYAYCLTFILLYLCLCCVHVSVLLLLPVCTRVHLNRFSLACTRAEQEAARSARAGC